MRSEEALVQPELLEWARKTMGMTVDAAAARLNVEPTLLRAWETGHRRPTIVQLRNIADLYKRPPALFYLSAPPEEPEPLQDFRSHREASSGRSPELIYAIRSAQERREIALELLDESPSPIEIQASMLEDPADVAARVRSFLSVSVEEQFSWGLPKALSCWKKAVEAKDIFVFETRKVSPTEARGFSISADVFPAVVLNGKDTPTGRLFTLMHELAHLVLRAGGLCDTIGEEERQTAITIEQFCNRVAGAVLMPKSAVERQPEARGKSVRSSWSDHEIRRLAAKFGVSREAMVLRLVELSLASWSFYYAKRKEYELQYQAAQSDDEDKPGAPIPQSVLARKYNGSLYTRVILSSYHRGSITLSEAAGHLHIRPKHFDALEAEVFR